jgi:SGNH hydrolase-like domain, acetyltransferase AlgX
MDRTLLWMVGEVFCKSLCKTLSINIAVSAILILLLDMCITLVHFEKDARSYGKDELTCASELTGYDYCKSIVQVNYMDKRDRILPVYNYIDAHGRSTYRDPSLTPSVLKTPKIYLLGDSFIQADELWIEERFEHLLRDAGFDVQANGYSSWNSWQFQRISETLNSKPGDEVFIFSMTNDYTPHYGNSTVKTLTKFQKTKDETLKVVDSGFWRDYSRQSFFLNRVFFDLKNIFAHLLSASPQAAAEDKNRPQSKVCSNGPDSVPMAVTDVAEDYLMLSQSSDCWSQFMIDSVDLNIAMLKRMKSKLEARGAIVHIMLVPAGWAFTNQNTVGRMAGEFQFQTNTVVSHKGLFNYLQAQGLDVDDLTEPLAGRGQNLMYFAVDGHWTQHAHRVIFTHLMDRYLKNK